MSEIKYDIVIVGGSLGGAAAAWSAAQQGASVCLIEATGWLGGRFNPQDLTLGAQDPAGEPEADSLSYHVFREAVQSYYDNADNLFAEAVAQRRRPSGGECAGFPQDSPVEHRILSQFLAAFPKVHVRLHTKISHVETCGDTIVSLTVVDPIGATRCMAAYFLDATDLGDLLSVSSQSGSDRVPAAEPPGDIPEPPGSDGAGPEGEPGTPPAEREGSSAGEDRPLAKWASWDPLHQKVDYQTADGCKRTIFEPGRDLWAYGSSRTHTDCTGSPVPISPDMLPPERSEYRAVSVLAAGPGQRTGITARFRRASSGRLYWPRTDCPCHHDLVNALVPARLTNLLAACADLGAIRLPGGALRLRSSHWNIGETAGALAAYCIAGNVSPATVAATPDVRRDFQRLLLAIGVSLCRECR